LRSIARDGVDGALELVGVEVPKYFRAAETIACSRSLMSSDRSMFRSRAIESTMRIISWVFMVRIGDDHEAHLRGPAAGRRLVNE
jgi:hypothetical protein